MITEGLQTKLIFLDPNFLQVENQEKTVYLFLELNVVSL